MIDQHKKNNAKDNKEAINNTPKNENQKRIQGLLILAILLGIFGWLCFVVGKPMIALASEPEKFRQYMDELGLWGIWVFVGMTVLQIILAIIPGGPLEIAAGYAFGVVKGTLICSAAMALGSTIVFLLTRKFGMRFIRLFFSQEKIDSVKILKTNKNSDLFIFLLFLIPGTPKDILSYLVGLTDMKLIVWIAITFFGRLPSIVLSIVGGNALHAKNVFLFVGIMIVLVVLCGIGYWYYRRINNLAKSEEEQQNKNKRENELENEQKNTEDDSSV